MTEHDDFDWSSPESLGEWAWREGVGYVPFEERPYPPRWSDGMLELPPPPQVRGDRSFLRKRGIDPEGEVARHRGYRRFESLAELLELAPYLRRLRNRPSKKGTKPRAFNLEANWLNRGAHGWLLPRHAVPIRGLRDPMPQVRPDNPPDDWEETDRHAHRGFNHVTGAHCACGAREHDAERPFIQRPIPPYQLAKHLREEHGYDPEYLDLLVEAQALRLRAQGVAPVYSVAEEDGVIRINPRRVLYALVPGFHVHPAYKKYLIPGPLVEREDGTVTGGEGKRLDANPMLRLRHFQTARRVFFVLEGCTKTDALTQAGEAVFGVPSVGQWTAPELDEWLARLRKSTPLYIVCDSDTGGEARRNVWRQAFTCREYIRAQGFTAVEVVHPPLLPGGRKAGVDDHLACTRDADGSELVDANGLVRHRTVDELLVQPPPCGIGGGEPDTSILDPSWWDKRPGPKSYDVALAALRWLQLHCLPGEYTVTFIGATVAKRELLLERGTAGVPDWDDPTDTAAKAELDVRARQLIRALDGPLVAQGIVAVERPVNHESEAGRQRRIVVTDKGTGQVQTYDVRPYEPYARSTANVRRVTLLGNARVEFVPPIPLGEWETMRALEELR